MSNIVTAAFLNSRIAKTRSLWKFDNGMILHVSGIELPEYFEIHFANTGDGTTTLVLGHNNEAEIPNDYLATGKEVNAYIYLHTGDADGYTLYHAIIPVKPRPKPNDGEPTKTQEEAIDAAIEALNTSAQEAAESAESAEASAVRAEEAAASIDEGMIAEAVADYLDDHPITVDETDPTVPEWAKQPNKPSYTPEEIGAVPAEAGKGLSTNDYTTAEKQKLAGIEAGADKTPDLSGYATKTELNNKVDKVSGKGLSTNDYTTAEKNKLSGIEAGADKTPDLSHYVTDSDYDPDSKTSDQTQPVGRDANGKLWTAPGGGGGTTDYDQLTNRPLINGHTLTGDQTAAQLGLATPSDIPTVPTKTSDLTNDSGFVNASGAAAAAPVQSVNGKTGAVELNAADVGAGTYSKPSGGIPASDLASAVQTSLGKADSALQSVPSTYRTAAAQDVIDAQKVNTSDYNPDSKTSDMTQAVGKDSNGKLWTAPGGGGGSSDYDDLENKPQIGGVTVQGSKTLAEFGIRNPPSGGSSDQVLAKASAADGDFKWMSVSGGSGGSSRTLLGEVAISGGINMNIVSIDYATGVITVDDCSALPSTAQAYTGAKVCLIRKNLTAKINTLPTELHRDNLGIEKITDTTLYLLNNSGRITSYTDATTIDLSAWAIQFHPSGSSVLEIANLSLSNHMILEAYTPCCLIAGGGIAFNLRYGNNKSYLGYGDANGVRSFYGQDAYAPISFRTSPYTNGSMGTGVLHGCGLPNWIIVDLKVHGDIIAVEFDGSRADARTANDGIGYNRDINSLILENNGLNKIRVNPGKDFAAFPDGAYLKVWEVND